MYVGAIDFAKKINLPIDAKTDRYYSSLHAGHNPDFDEMDTNMETKIYKTAVSILTEAKRQLALRTDDIQIIASAITYGGLTPAELAAELDAYGYCRAAIDFAKKIKFIGPNGENCITLTA